MNRTMINFSKFDSLFAMMMYFNNEDTCMNAIVEMRWGSGTSKDVVCPYCGEHHCVTRKDGKFRCNHCKRNFTYRVGTIFEDSKLSLVKWFMAMYLISSHKKGISSCQLARDLDITQKTAWYLLHKIRTLFAQDDSERFSGEVECDEVYIGGKEKWKHRSMQTPNTQGRSTKTKTSVFGLMERQEYINLNGEKETMSYAHAMIVEKTDGKTLLPIIGQFVEEGSTIYTDELSSYNKVSDMGYVHKICNHSGLEFVTEDGEVYTNNIECFWSHSRRMISGCYHDVSDEHLQSYIDEAVYRWNTRKLTQSERFKDMFAKFVGIVVTWKELRLCYAA